jgi:hypothetical protein
VPLVGLRGLCVVGDGRSPPKAVRNAVLMAARFVQDRLVDSLARRIAQTSIAPSAAPSVPSSFRELDSSTRERPSTETNQELRAPSVSEAQRAPSPVEGPTSRAE